MHIDNAYPGANPPLSEDVVSVGENSFLIRPWSEDGDGNYKFRLNVKVINEASTPEPLHLAVDWDDVKYMGDRDYILLGPTQAGTGPEWRWAWGQVEGAVTSVDLTVPPGEWYLGLHPVHDLAMFEEDRRRATAAGLTEEVIGQSTHGRDLVALSAGAQGAPTMLVVSRFHPYETAGSHCVSAILDLLAKDLAKGGPLTTQRRFVVVPMPNPDGVALGCCKRSRFEGPDLCHQGADAPDPAGQALAGLLARTAPQAYLDLHGWMWREYDGLGYTHQAQRDAFVALLAGDPFFDKAWRGSDLSGQPFQPGDFRSRAHHDHGAVCLIMSISWFGRTVLQMRAAGPSILSAFCQVMQGA